jgi:tetratricopeptide (TPR) repeat protein
MQNKNERESFMDRVNNFIQRNRRGITITLCLFVAMFIGLIAYLVISDNLNKKAIAEVDELTSRFEEFMFFSIEDYLTEDVDILLADIEDFAMNNNRGFPGSKAWSMAGHIYSGRQDWDNAQTAWQNSVRQGERTYLGPIALFNAAVVAEEQGKIEEAIGFYKQSLSHDFEFPAAPRAQFSIGRLNESLGNFDEAVEAYREVMINWPEIPVWQHLAQSRIIYIETR